jgi:hypothetical protein
VHAEGQSRQPIIGMMLHPAFRLASLQRQFFHTKGKLPHPAKPMPCPYVKLHAATDNPSCTTLRLYTPKHQQHTLLSPALPSSTSSMHAAADNNPYPYIIFCGCPGSGTYWLDIHVSIGCKLNSQVPEALLHQSNTPHAQCQEVPSTRTATASLLLTRLSELSPHT